MKPTISPTAPAARRRVPRAEREERMLDAAGRAFATRGFHAASMDGIAEAAGISKPMLYNYFGSKEGLYVAYVERSGHALVSSMRAAAPADAPVQERLWAGTLAFLSYVDDHRSGWAVLYKEATSQGGPVAAEVAGLRARIAGMLAQLFESNGVADEASGGAPGAAFAHAFVGAGESLANWWLEHPTEPKERVARLLMRLAQVALSSQDEVAARSTPR